MLYELYLDEAFCTVNTVTVCDHNIKLCSPLSCVHFTSMLILQPLTLTIIVPERSGL